MVLVAVVTGLLAGGQLSPASATVEFLLAVVGALAIGAVVGSVASVLARGSNDHLVEATLSVAAAYGAYLLGQQLRVSGILAVVCAGSVFGNLARRFGMSAGTDDSIEQLWRFLAFVANSLVFLLLGLAVVPVDLLRLGPLIVLGVAATLLGRAVVAYGLGTSLALVSGLPVLAWRHVPFWGGVRGALPVVVAIVVTEEFQISTILRDLVLGVVIVTLLLQGLTLHPVLTYVLRRCDQRQATP